MNEEGANFGSVVLRVEQRRLAASPLIAAIKGFALAPTPTSDNGPARFRAFFRHKIRFVRYQLSINPIDGCERAFNLRGRVILRLQAADGGIDQIPKNGNVGGGSGSNVNLHAHGVGSVRT